MTMPFLVLVDTQAQAIVFFKFFFILKMFHSLHFSLPFQQGQPFNMCYSAIEILAESVIGKHLDFMMPCIIQAFQGFCLLLH